MRQTTIAMTTALAVLALGACSRPKAPQANRTEPSAVAVYSQVPNPVDRDANYLIYLHGAIIESQGTEAVSPEYGPYEYDAILKAFADRGFTVVSAVRPAGTRPDTYAAKVAAEVRTLLDAGVPESRVTVVGFSKGAVIALLASREVGRPGVNWVIQAGCGSWIERVPDFVPAGRILSQVDGSDKIAGSCAPLFARMPEGSTTAETILDLGLGHGSFYKVRPEWFEGAVRWAGR